MLSKCELLYIGSPALHWFLFQTRWHKSNVCCPNPLVTGLQAHGPALEGTVFLPQVSRRREWLKPFSRFVSCPINHSDRACCYLTLHIVLAAAGSGAGPALCCLELLQEWKCFLYEEYSSNGSGKHPVVTMPGTFINSAFRMQLSFRWH